MTASQDKQLQQHQGAAPSMPPPPRPGPPSGESVMPGSGQFDYGQLGQQAGGEKSWPKCAPYFSTLIQASWRLFGLPEPAKTLSFLRRLMMQLLDSDSSEVSIVLCKRINMVTTGYQRYARILREGISNGMSPEESRASAPQRMMDETKARSSERAGDLRRIEGIELQDHERFIDEMLRWKALVDTVGVPEVLLIDRENVIECDFGDDMPMPGIACASDEDWPHLLAKLLSPEFGLKETCMRLSGIVDMIEHLNGLEESDLRKYLVSSIEKRVKSVLGTRETLPDYESLSSDDDSMADAE